MKVVITGVTGPEFRAATSSPHASQLSMDLWPGFLLRMNGVRAAYGLRIGATVPVASNGAEVLAGQGSVDVAWQDGGALEAYRFLYVEKDGGFFRVGPLPGL